MRYKGIVLVYIFNILIDGFCKLNKLIEVNKLFRDMIDMKIVSSNVIFIILIDYYCKMGMMEDVDDFFLEM